ncbi:MAG: S9 family peptidase, partial [Planctomycetes bacterium]|nr:S9 family peptidase [Planctomycetota bacterium]
ASAWHPDGTRVAVLHGADDAPTDLFLFGPDGRERRITDSTTAEFRRRERAVVRYVTFPSLVDDAVLHARILEPRGLDRSRRHPVIFGPVYSNTVRNRWGGFYAQLQQLMVERGYLVVQVDVRGSTGYGRAFREDFLADFAGRDLDDLESAVAYLEGLGHVDPDRIGIWGSSYGGTLTAYALLKKPGLFDAGVACAAAVDPRFFGSDDVAIVRRPDTHPEAFARGAAQYAAALEDPLLLIHGMQDQVVPFKTIIVLAEELMKAGKNFDMAFAPGGTHGWTGRRHHARYLLGKLLAHFDRHLAGR